VSRSRVSAASAILLGAALAGVAFGAAGGTVLHRTVLVEVLVVVAGALVVAAAVLFGRRGPQYGALSLVAFGALAAVTALSVTWSIVPELSYVEAGRMLAYLAAFAAAVAAARVAPAASPVALKGIALGAVAVVIYALASRVWPGALAENELSNRIGQPFGYWNAVGTTAALAVPALLWLGARRTGSLLGRALAYPALGLCVMAILLTQSRGALAAALLGALAWVAIVPLRLRSLPVVVLPVLAAGPVAAWALSRDAFSESLQPLSAKESVAGEFGGLLVLMVAVLLVAGLAVNLGLARNAPSVRIRRRVGIAAVGVACLVPLALFTSVAFSDRGLGGTIEDRVDELTSETDSAPAEGGGRLTAASSTRGKYWREAGKIFEDRPSLGTGSGTFGIARLRYRKDELVSRHAHGYVAQTLADTGLLGLGATLFLLAAWLAAAARTTGLYPRWRRFGASVRRRDWNGERIALVALALVAVVFGLQSAIDWTWFVPGPAVMALVAAGFVAGRGPLPAVPALAGAPAAAATPPTTDPHPIDTSRIDLRALPRPGRARIAAAAAIFICALLFAWAIWQPEASDNASEEALHLSAAGQTGAALSKAADAADANPLSSRPLLVKAAVETRAGRSDAARRTLEKAVLRFPGEAQTWLKLASFQLGTLERPREALRTLTAVLYLDPFSKAGRDLYLEARAAEREEARPKRRPRP
jgi:tetratricopeptide (TPR) repeat protein